MNPADVPLNTIFNDLAIGTTVTFRFSHGGNPFRISMTKTDSYVGRMTAYAGAEGPMERKNRIESLNIYCERSTLARCIYFHAASCFDIIPVDLKIVSVFPPRIVDDN